MTDRPPNALTRRQALRVGTAAATSIAFSSLLSSCTLLAGGSNNSTEGSAGLTLNSEATLPEPFRTTLPVPPVLEPVRRDRDTDYYEIVQRVGRATILPELETEVWGYNGIVPGPTIVSQSNRRTVVTHRNELPVPVAVHLHGGKTAPEHDGYPTDLILPIEGDTHSEHSTHGDSVVGSRRYVYEMEQPAATLWYHDHRMDFTGPQVYRGLAGFHLIHDETEASLGLPDGEFDIPLMIMDRAFAADGSFHYPSVDATLTHTPGVTKDYMSGVLGDCILVNGAAWPQLEVSQTAYRFRILNASNARRYRLSLDGAVRFVQIGSDQGLLASPVEHDLLEIAQAERFDVIIDFSDCAIGDKITMTNELGSDGTAQIMRFQVARTGPPARRIPERLTTLETLASDDVVAERDFVFARGGAEAHDMTLWTVNGEAFSPDTVVARPKLGTTERWTIHARNVEHPFHIHLAPFQVVGLGGDEDPGPYNHGWKDTVNLDNGQKAVLLIRFDGHRGKYVFHCHNLEHEDMMMMANFAVV